MRSHQVFSAGIGLAMLTTAGLVVAFVLLAYDARPAPTSGAPVAGAPAVTQTAPVAPVAPDAGGPAATDPYRPDDAWLTRTATVTGIPARALQAYARAHLRTASEQPECRVSWNSIAAIGGIESAHGSANGAALGPDGRPRPDILGPALDGGQFAAIHDTDDGSLDGDRRWDRAVGPLQFIPSTWERWGADGNGDGAADPHQVDDAALAATRYLCHSGDLSDPDTWRRAIFSFNHSDAYVADIAYLANVYAARAG